MNTFKCVRWAIVAGLLGAISSPAHALTLKLAAMVPDGTSWMTEVRQAADAISKETQGRVKFKIYPGGIMGGSSSVLRKMRVGQLQGGSFTMSGLAGIYPDIQLYGLPFLFRDHDEVNVIRQKMDATLIDGLNEAGFVTLGMAGAGFAYLMSNKPISSVADVKGQKIWIPQGDMISEEILRAVGITPVALTLADVYTGLQTGLVDTVASSPTATIAFQWHTRVTHLTDIPLLYLLGLLVVDRKAFGRIAPADQAIVKTRMAEAFERLDKLSQAEDANARDALQQQGIQFVTLDSTERARWSEIADTATAALGDRGAYTPDLLKTLETHLEAHRGP